MKKITLPDFKTNRKSKSNHWYYLLTMCLAFFLTSTSLSYGQVDGAVCGTPLTITSLPYNLTGNTSAYGDDYDTVDVPPTAPGAIGGPSASNFYISGDDVVFSITPTISGQIDVVASDVGTWAGLYVFTGCPFASTVGHSTNSTAGSRSILALPVVANTTYYIVISTWPTPQSTAFILNVTGTEGLLAPLIDCAGTPEGGIATLTPNGGNGGSIFSAKSTGASVGLGLLYQWQKEIAGSWQDIAGATTINSSITAETGAVGTATNYRLKVTCSNSSETAYSTVTAYTIQLVYCGSVPTSKDGSGITNLTVGVTSFPVPNATYYDYPTAVDVFAGITNPTLITFATGYTYHTNIWIDLNNNGTFEATELLFQGESTNANPTIFDASFLMSAEAPVGLHKMRIGTADAGQETPNPCYNLSYGVTVDLMVNILPPPVCLPPAALTASGITSTSANLSWTSTGTSFIIEYGTLGFAQGTGTTATSTTPSYIVSALEANTSYSYYVRQDCGTTDGLSIWSGPFTFKTACGTLTTFFENFDTSLTGASNPLPSCWAKAGNGSTYITTGSVAPNSPANRLYMFANGTATTPTESFAIMPAVSNLQAQTHRLKFKAYSSALNKTLEIGYFTELTDLSTFVLLETIDLPGTAQSTTEEFSFEPNGIPAGVTNLVFRNNAPSGSVTIYIDDVSWEVLPLCDDITDISLQTFNSNSATISWEPGGSETAWSYVYGPAATTTSPVGLTPVSVSNNPVLDLTGLEGNTSYKVWIRSNCAAGEGNWPQNPFTFTTSCNTVTAFVENFDSYTSTGSTNPLPSCWTRYGNTANIYITTGSTSPMTPANRLYLSASATGTSLNAVAVMPPVSNLQAGTHRLKFKAFATSTGKSIEIGYYESAGDVESFVVVEAFELPGTTVSTTQEFTYTPEFIPDGIESLVFRNHGPAFTGTTTMYIDDVAWEPLPSCFDITEITVSNITSTTADVEWNSGGSETAWEYVIAPSTVASPEGLTPVAVTNTPYLTITDLMPSTSYKLWIRSNCGGGLLGNWSSVKTFVTACAPITTLPWNEGFEGVTTVGSSAFPPCWFKENGDWSTALASSYNTPRTGITYLRDSWSAANEYMWTPGFELTANTSYDFSFFMQGDGYTGWNIDVFYNTSQTSTNATQLGNTSVASGAGSTAMQSYQLVNNTFVPQATGVYYFAVRVNQPSSSPWYIAFDDFNLKLSPNCVPPTLTAVTNITTTTATGNWTAPLNAPANGYEYFLTTTATIPTGTTVPTGSVTAGIMSTDLTALTSSSNYRLYVRSVCGASETSAWSQAILFTTLCDTATLPYTINFESVTIPDLPLCTTTENVGTGNNWATVNNPGSGFTTKTLKYNYNFSNAANTWFFTNVFNLVAGQEYSVSYRYGAGSATYVESLEVAYGIAANSSDMTTILANHPSINTNVAQNNTVNFTPTTSGTYVIGFRAYSIANQLSLFLDDIVIQVALGTSDFDSNNFVAYPNPVKDQLTIRYNENISDVTVFNLLGQQLFSKSINATEGKVDMSNLASGNYLVKVTSGDKVQTIKVIKQ